MEKPALDKIIGSSPLSQNNMSVHYKTGVCAFAADGFFSIVIPKEKLRYDHQPSEDSRPICALTFSSTGHHLAIGEKGSNARCFIFSFSEKFDSITSSIIIKTRENGFSFLALNFEKNRLITVGIEQQPFLLLWDLSKSIPPCIGCYHLSSIPTSVVFSLDCSFAFVSGNHLLKFIQTSVSSQPGSKPVILKAVNANIAAFKDQMFVGCAISWTQPYTAYGLTNNGVLLFYEPSVIPFQNNHRQNRLLSAISIDLHHNRTTSIVLDRKIILVGTEAGPVLTIKVTNNDNNFTHSIFGQFSSVGCACTSVGIAEKMTTVSYVNGTTMIWLRKLNSSPVLTIPSHHGPICSLAIIPKSPCIVTCGTDCTLRAWKLQKNEKFLNQSSQEEVCIKNYPVSKHDNEALSGLRCIAFCRNLIFVGDSRGNLHVVRLKINVQSSEKEKVKEIYSFEDLKTIVSSNSGVLSLAVHESQGLLATGNEDGSVNLYSISNDANVNLCGKTRKHSRPVAALCFCGNNLVSVAADSLNLMKLDKSLDLNNQTITISTKEPIICVDSLPSGKAIVTGGSDNYLCFWLTNSEMKLFRRYKLSHSAYPVALSVDPTGLFVAVALSDGSVRIVDVFSGDTVLSFNGKAEIVTDITFEDHDLIVTTYSGCIMRWILPNEIHSAMLQRDDSNPNQKLFDILNDAPSPGPPRLIEQSHTAISGSLMKSKGTPEYLFKEIKDALLPGDKPVVGENNDDDDVDQAGYDAPRPSVQGEFESHVDDVIRLSYIRRSSAANDDDADDFTKVLRSIQETHSPPKPSKSIDNFKNDNFLNNNNNVSPSFLRFNNSNNSNSTNNNISNISSNEPPKIVKKSKADEIKQTVKELDQIYKTVKQELEYQPQTGEEIEAKAMLMGKVEEIKKDMLKDSHAISQIKINLANILSVLKDLE